MRTIIIFLIVWKLLPQNPPVDHKPRFDWQSAVENMIVFGLIFFALGNFSRKGDLLLSGILLIIGIVVGIFSYTRTLGHKSELHM